VPRTFHLFMIYNNSTLNPPQYVVPAGSLSVPADSAHVVTVELYLGTTLQSSNLSAHGVRIQMDLSNRI